MDKELLVKCFKTMLKIRMFEERMVELEEKKEIFGWLHTYVGEEAVATGACLNLEKSDYITSTHRGHGHLIAKGASIKHMVAELFAKKTGYCKGRGGSMHIADASIGILGANGIVGAGIPIATGAGFACNYLKNNKVVVSFFGDGAADQGGFHESLNLASIWKFPVIYLIENNMYALSFRCDGKEPKHVNIDKLSERAKAYGIPGITVDGMDVIDVYENIHHIIDDVRSGKGPMLVEAKTYRFRGHHGGDAEVYRTKQEVKEWREKDPIPKLTDKLRTEGIISQKDIDKIKKGISDELEEAIEFARKSPNPKPEEATDYVFSS